MLGLGKQMEVVGRLQDWLIQGLDGVTRFPSLCSGCIVTARCLMLLSGGLEPQVRVSGIPLIGWASVTCAPWDQ